MNEEVLYPHRKTPWAGRWNDQGRIVHGLFDPATGERRLIDPATDQRMPGLRPWLSRGQLVTYRPSRRATVAVVVEGEPAFVKVVPLRRVEELSYRYERNRKWLQAAGVSVPELLMVDKENGALVLSALTGQSLHDQLFAQQLDFEAIGSTLGRIARRSARGLRQRSASDFDWWRQQVADWDPENDGVFAAAVERLLLRIGPVDPAAPGFEHGDLHDRNLFLGEDGRLGMIDFDQAGQGDSQADLVCLTAHLELRAIQQGREPPDREIRDLWKGFGLGHFPLRTRKATAAELARLACLYRFRGRWRPLTRDVLARAQSWLEPARARPRASALDRLRTALIPGRLANDLAEADFDWLDGSISGADVTRVGVESKSFVLDLDVDVSGRHRRMIAEIPRTEDPAAALSNTMESLAKKRRGQRPAEGYGIGLVPETGMVVRSAGLDRRIPVLRLIHVPQSKGGLLGAEVLSHRLGKRVTIRTAHSEIIKGYKVRSPLPEATFERGAVLAAAAPPLGGPRPLEILSEQRAVVWQAETPTPPGQHEKPSSEAVALTAAALRQFHATENLQGPPHDLTRELDQIDRLAQKVRLVRPEMADLIDATLAKASSRVVDLGLSPTGPIHRDAHPGQFIVQDDRALVIDVDTLAKGDPAIDLGNYSAHLSMLGAEEACEALLSEYGADRALRRRAEVWKGLSLLRLSLDGLLTTRRASSAFVALESLR